MQRFVDFTDVYAVVCVVYHAITPFLSRLQYVRRTRLLRILAPSLWSGIRTANRSVQFGSGRHWDCLAAVRRGNGDGLQQQHNISRGLLGDGLRQSHLMVPQCRKFFFHPLGVYYVSSRCPSQTPKGSEEQLPASTRQLEDVYVHKEARDKGGRRGAGGELSHPPFVVPSVRLFFVQSETEAVVSNVTIRYTINGKTQARLQVPRRHYRERRALSPIKPSPTSLSHECNTSSHTTIQRIQPVCICHQCACVTPARTMPSRR